MNWLKSFWKALTGPPKDEGRSSSEAVWSFTPRAQQVLALARMEADRFHHNFVGTEHLLLGLVGLGDGVAVAVLRKLGIHLETVRLEVEKQVGTGPDRLLKGPIPYTPRVKKTLALALKEAQALKHTYVGTEHLLLALIEEGDGVAARVLKNLGVDALQTRAEILKELDPNYPPAARDIQSMQMSQHADAPKVRPDSIDTSKRYDVYCSEKDQAVVVYRNALFKGRRRLLSPPQHDIRAEFLELELANGQTVYVPAPSVRKFCEPGATIEGETIPPKG